MKHTLVGYTGFVGSNLAASHKFDNLYNSANIQKSFGRHNGLVVYAGMPSEKFLANSNPQADYAIAQQAMQNIDSMKPDKLVLISTVDVYPDPQGVFEDTRIQNREAPAYGKNRLALENWVRREYPRALIVRLPGLYGKGLKKNFIYDMFTITPSALTPVKYEELAGKESLIARSYQEDGKGFYRLRPGLTLLQGLALKEYFAGNDFNALSFTDSRSVFQFYNLARLWHDIVVCLNEGMTLVNLATEPVQAAQLYQKLFHKKFENIRPGSPAQYDMRTRFGRTLGDLDNYLEDADRVIESIAEFARCNFG